MTWLTGTINPATTSPAADISKITNDLQLLRATLSGTVDTDVPVTFANGLNINGSLSTTWGGVFGANTAGSSGVVQGVFSVTSAAAPVTGAPTVAQMAGGLGLWWGNVYVGMRTIHGGDANNAGLAMLYAGGGTVKEGARIDASGNFLVGQTATGLQNSNSFSVAATGVLGVSHITGAASGTAYSIFGYAGTQIGSITQSGTTAVLYNTTSDARLKANIADAADAGALLDAVQVRQYDWKADGSHQRFGFVAQELVKVVPEAVHQPEDADQMMAVDYSKLVPLLVKEIQALRARVAKLGG